MSFHLVTEGYIRIGGQSFCQGQICFVSEDEAFSQIVNTAISNSKSKEKDSRTRMLPLESQCPEGLEGAIEYYLGTNHGKKAMETSKDRILRSSLARKYPAFFSIQPAEVKETKVVEVVDEQAPPTRRKREV